MRVGQQTACLILLATLLLACQPVPSNLTAIPPADTQTPPAIPTHIPLTPTPTIYVPPTQTYTPAPAREVASVSELPSEYTLHLSGVGPHLREIYERGQALGRDSTRFSKIGDCHSNSRSFLQPIDRGTYELGDYAYLQPTIEHFRGSFLRVGPAALDGMHMDTLLDPLWTDPQACGLTENRIACEVRLHNPSVALIFIQPHLTTTESWSDLFYTSLRTAVEDLLEAGIIPVLTTQIDWQEHPAVTAETNRIIRQVAEEYNMPLWDFHASTVNLDPPADTGNWHLSTSPHGSTNFADPRSMEYAMTLRNLEAMQVLHYLLQEVMH